METCQLLYAFKTHYTSIYFLFSEVPKNPVYFGEIGKCA